MSTLTHEGPCRDKIVLEIRNDFQARFHMSAPRKVTVLR
jgi:hypothetical protein